MLKRTACYFHLIACIFSTVAYRSLINVPFTSDLAIQPPNVLYWSGTFSENQPVPNSVRLLFWFSPWVLASWTDCENLILFLLLQFSWFNTARKLRLFVPATTIRKTSIRGGYFGWLRWQLLLIFLFLMMRWLIALFLFRLLSWSFPVLFSHWSAHESTTGLGYHLIPWLMLQITFEGSEWLDHKETLGEDQEEQDTLAHVLPRLGLFAFVWINMLFPDSLDGSHGGWNLVCSITIGWLLILGACVRLRFQSKAFRRQLRWSLFFKPFMVVLLLSSIWFGMDTWGKYHRADLSQWKTVPSETPTLLTAVFVSAPRPNDKIHSSILMKTLQTYLPTFYPRGKALVDRVKFNVMTCFPHHRTFNRAQAILQQYVDVSFHRIESKFSHPNETQDAPLPVSLLKQRQHHHYADILDYAARQLTTRYVLLVEDDFPLCPNAWPRLLRLLIRAQQPPYDTHCALFLGTGGSGILLKHAVLDMLVRLLRDYAGRDPASSPPTDILMQQCITGRLPECAVCRGTLVISSELLMFHSGFNASTFTGRTYHPSEFQCGWRHPMNGLLDVYAMDVR